jgi:hypothetical protein
MSAATIRAAIVESAKPGADGYGSSGHFIELRLDMTKAQRKAAIIELLGLGWGESEAFEWFASEFPEWVAPATLPQWVKDAAEVPA